MFHFQMSTTVCTGLNVELYITYVKGANKYVGTRTSHKDALLGKLHNSLLIRLTGSGVSLTSF